MNRNGEEALIINPTQKVVRIAASGAPGCGKSTIIADLKERLSETAWETYATPEAATQLIAAGMLLPEAVAKNDQGRLISYEESIGKATIFNEDICLKNAEISGAKQAVILCDRGVPDIDAYLSFIPHGHQMYEAMLAKWGLSAETAFARYDTVLLLEAAPKEHYTTANNPARKEGYAAAVEIGERFKKVWLGHEHIASIPSTERFEDKRLKALQEVYHSLGLPVPLEREYKYEIKFPCLAHFPVATKTVQIEQAYLSTKIKYEERRIRRRSIGSGSSFYLTNKRPIGPATRAETNESITWRRYYELLRERDPVRGILQKDRTCFLWDNQYFQLDIYRNLDRALCTIEIEVTDAQEKPHLPDFILRLDPRDVTDDPEFKNYELAKHVVQKP
ncbi:MAG: AAA family ATPase [Candidatus Liptonbacteria bacterium]|nr:AAA family ATPase [Candidatus Liptonbacteria bacterium]